MPNNSYSTVSNIRITAVEPNKEIWWYAQEVDIPFISVDNPKSNTRAGALGLTSADTASFGSLKVKFILDKEWEVYDSLYMYFLEGLNVETGKFSTSKKFELIIDFVDGDGKTKRKFFFHSCRLVEFGGVQAVTTTQEEELQYIEVTFDILYFTSEKVVY